MVGITYRGLHSRRDIGVVTKTVTRPIAAPVRTIEENVPYRDGSLDYSEIEGRLFYDDKILEIEISVVKKNLKDLHKKISKVVSWICGSYADLIFDDMPYVVWEAKPVSLDGIAPELQRVGKTTVQFRCRPFNRLLYDSTGIPLDSDIPLDSNIELDYGADSEQSLPSGQSSILFDYIGTAPASPQIIVSGDVKTLHIIVHDVTFKINLSQAASAYEGVIIDCENWRCLGVDGTNLMQYTSGDFPELLPGENKIDFVTDNTCNLQFVFYPNYLYGDVGFDDE